LAVSFIGGGNWEYPEKTTDPPQGYIWYLMILIIISGDENSYENVSVSVVK
jgi:hypothetical protein